MADSRSRRIRAAVDDLQLGHILTDELLLNAFIEGVRGVLYQPPITGLSRAIVFTNTVVRLQYLNCSVARDYSRQLFQRQDVADVLTFARLLRGVTEFSLDAFADVLANPLKYVGEITLMSLREGTCHISIVWDVRHTPPFIRTKSIAFYDSRAVFRCKSDIFDWWCMGAFWSVETRRFHQQAMVDPVLDRLYQVADAYDAAMSDTA